MLHFMQRKILLLCALVLFLPPLGGVRAETPTPGMEAGAPQLGQAQGGEAPASAEEALRRGMDEARQAGESARVVSQARLLGRLLVRQKRVEEAFALLREASKLAADPRQQVEIHCDLAAIVDDGARSSEELQAAYAVLENIPDSDGGKGELLARVASEAARKQLGGAGGCALRYRVLSELFELARAQGDERLLSQASGWLGALYEQQGRAGEAEALTAQAMEKAQALQAHDLLLDWEWQWARLARAAQRLDEAIAAFRRAVFHIESIRHDIPIVYEDGRSSFRMTLEPIYLGLADMLLEKARSVQGEQEQDLLHEARSTMEVLKESELRDYFHDECIVARSRRIEHLAAGTAVLYPIILPERLEILVDMGGTLHQVTRRVDRQELADEVNALARQLRYNLPLEELTPHAAKLYELMIKPFEPLLAEQKINALVFVPDGVLRLLPLAVLWDGNDFLVSRYAVATVAGLTLLDPKELERSNLLTLLAGVSSPGPVVGDLPRPLLTALRQAAPAQKGRGVRGFSVKVEELDIAPPQTGEQDSGDLTGARELLALPGVTREIEELARELPSRVLLNEEFALEQFSRELESRPYRIVHIASHGFFGGSPEQNFVMAYDRVINMNSFEEMIRPKQFADLPVELVSLSACQTAEGDDRSPLGLSGVALKSGARSAMGSLWPVSDEAAQLLLTSFYANLKDPALSKAEALRRAQYDLRRRPGFAHPFFWSPFILVGNWL